MSESKYEIWSDIFSLEDAAAWQDVGIEQRIALQWLEWGADLEVALLVGGNYPDYSDVPDIAFRESAGLSLSEAADWRDLGVSSDSVTPISAGKAVESGLAYSEWAPFMRLVGADSHFLWSVCNEFARDNVFDCFHDLIRAGVPVEEAPIRRWLGLTAEQIFDSVDRGFRGAAEYAPYALSSINSNEAEYLAASYGLHHERVVQLWHVLQAGVTADVAIPWIKAGFSGVETVTWLSAGFTVTVAVQWCTARFSTSDSSLWIRAGIHQPTEALEWARHSIDPDDASAWSTAGFTPGEAKLWATGGVAPTQAAARREAGLRPVAKWSL